MYLKSIEVHGFKSFANKIVFEFQHGITGIVGPNGSGKSNIADAVRWVLGEQSAKQLRGSNMQDVIFSGTELRKPQGFAYVAITIDNSDHKLPVEFDEVTVARRVYRSGESEYLMNGSNCRLKDVQELFFDTGIGKEGYSIIGQGQIDRIVSGKPEERRELLDEAAGIVKFKRRKAVAEKNLAEEQQNLSRVEDIVSELEKQVGPLAEQAEKAKEFLKYRDELRITEINQFLLEKERLDAQEKEFSEKKSVVENDLAETNRNFENTKTEYERLESELEVMAGKIDEYKESRAALNLEFEKNEGDIRLIQGQMESITQSKQHYSENQNRIQSNIAEKCKELEQYNAEKEKVESNLAVLRNEHKEAVAGLQELRAGIESINAEIEQSNSEIIRTMNENSDRKANLLRYQTMKEQNLVKKSEISKRVLQHKSKESQAQEDVKTCTERLKQVADKVYERNQAIQVMERKAEEESQDIGQITKQIDAKQHENMSASSRLDSIKSITERYEGYGNSIRRIMEQKAKFPGIHGVVADLISVDKTYETAIEIALGGNIQNIITADEPTAKGLIEFLKQNKAGRATFLPLTSINPVRNNNDAALRELGVIGLASSLVHADKQYSSLIQFLLGRIFIVDTIDNALRLAKKYNYSLRIVTLEGEQLNPGGSLSGGAYKNASNLLSRKREMEELEEKIAALNEEIEELNAKRDEKRNHRTELRQKIEKAKDEMQDLLIRQNTAKLKLDQANVKVKQLAEDSEGFSNELKNLDEESVELQKAMESLSKEIEDSVGYTHNKENRIGECGGLLKEKQQEESAKNEEISALLVKVSGAQQNCAYVQENIDRVLGEISQFEEEQNALNDTAAHFESSMKEKEAEIAEKRRMNEENRAKEKELVEQIEAMSKEREEKNASHKEFFTKREELSGRIHNLDKELLRIGGQLEKIDEQLESKVNYLWNEYELTPSGAEEMKVEELQNSSQNRKTIDSLKNKIKALGSVNVNAIEDYKSVSERYEFLTGQRDDLKNSEQTLRGIIAELDEEMRKRFTEKFDEITKQFDVVFKELFGGGKATLELVEDEDILEAGIRIIAQPPGKKLQNMMQLSGGEKALTAISLLFAIQNLKPSPFCLLDEIEAALDDSNVKRYAKYLHKLTKDTQFIVITHRRGTMAAADVLYGITMQEKGVSTLVSVSLIEDKLDK